MVTQNNNNKYYKMIPTGDSFEVEYGRVGSSCQHASYSISQWDKKYNEKIRKGYVDQTHLVQDLIQKVDSPKSKDNYKEIENKAIAEIVNRLREMAHKTVQANYKVSSNQVTQAMVDEAQNVIDKLITIQNVDDFNNTLLKLFTVIPRKMSNVNSYLATNKDDFARIIKDEQDLLDVMRGQVITQITEDNSSEEIEVHNDKTILEVMGLVFEEVTEREISMIKSKLGDCNDRFYQAWRVRNIATQNRFDTFCEEEGITNCKLLWHGSRNENWWSIINTGLMIRPSNAVYTGSMFGSACYFSPMARKSKGYTSLDGYWTRVHQNFGFMALMNVAYGKPYDVYSFDSKFYDFDYKRLQNTCQGANCLHAHGGTGMLRNDEIVIYNIEQCTIQYLVELR